MKPRSITPSVNLQRQLVIGAHTPIDQSQHINKSYDSADELDIPEEFNKANQKANSSFEKKRLRFESDDSKSRLKMSSIGYESFSSPNVQAALKYLNSQRDSGRSSRTLLQSESQQKLNRLKSPPSTKQMLKNILNKTYFSTPKDGSFAHSQQKDHYKENSSHISNMKCGISIDSVPKNSNDLKHVDAIKPFHLKEDSKNSFTNSMCSPKYLQNQFSTGNPLKCAPGKFSKQRKKQDSEIDSPEKEDTSRRAPNQSSVRVRLSQETKGDISKNYLSNKMIHTHKPSRRPVVVDENRLLEIQKKKEEKMQRIRDLELEGCTFHPRINSSHDSRRTLQSFLHDQSTFLELKHYKNQQLKQSLEKHLFEAEKILTPQITNRSRSLVEIKRRKEKDTRTTYDRLYDPLKSPRKINRDTSAPLLSTIPESVGHVPEFSFHPKIRERSKKLKRDGPVGDILYNDALKRRVKSADQSKPKKELGKKLYMNEHSKRLLAHKLIREFEITSEQFFADSVEEHKFHYLHMCEFLQALRFLQPSEDTKNPYFIHERTLAYDMWIVLRGDKYNGVNERNLLVMLLAIMGLNLPIPAYEHVNSSQKNSKGNELPRENSINSVNLSKSSHFKFYSGTFGPQDQNLIENMRLNKESSQTMTLDHTTAEDQKNTIINYSISPNASSLLNPNKESIEERQIVQIGRFDEKENVFFTDEEVKQISQAYEILYTNRLYFNDRKVVNPPQYSFMPTILENSEKLANAFREKQLAETANYIIQTQNSPPSNMRLSHADLLLYHKAVQDLKMDEKKQDYMKKKLEECSFTPKISKGRVNVTQVDVSANNIRSPTPTDIRRGIDALSLAKSQPFRRDKSYVEWYDEKYKNECTFKPNISSAVNRKNYIQQSLENIRDVDKSIERAKIGREQREILNEARNLRNAPANGLPTQRVSSFNFGLEKRETQHQVVSKRGSSTKTARKDHSLNRSATPVNDVTQRSTPYKNFLRGAINETFVSEQNNNTKDSILRDGQDEPKRAASNLSGLNERQSNSAFNQEVITKGNRRSKNQLEGALPILHVDVNLGKDKTERIEVFTGDNAADLATKFSQEHGLPLMMKEKLQELLEIQIAGIMKKTDKNGFENSLQKNRETRE